MNNKIVAISIITIIFLIIVITHPTKETIVCDSNFACKMSQQYLNSLTFNTHFAINQNSEITFDTRPKYSRKYTPEPHKATYVKLNKKRLFKQHLYYGSWLCNEMFQKSESKKFDDYKLGNVSEYKLSSHVDFLSSPYPGILLLFAISMIILFPNITSKSIF